MDKELDRNTEFPNRKWSSDDYVEEHSNEKMFFELTTWPWDNIL